MNRLLIAVGSFLATPCALAAVKRAAETGQAPLAVTAAVIAAVAAFTFGWITAQVGIAIRSQATPRSRWGGDYR